MNGFPVILPSPGSLDAGALAVSRIAKCVLTADTTLSSDAYHIMVGVATDLSSAADSVINIPLFIFPEGMTVEDIGFETSMVWTESVGIVFGDCADSDGWGSTVTFVATDTDAAGVIRWMSRYMQVTELESSVKLDSTGIVPAYLAWGPKTMWCASDDTGQDTTLTGLDTDVLDYGFGYALHHIDAHIKGAIAATGVTSVYIKYNFANFLQPHPTTDMAIRD